MLYNANVTGRLDLLLEKLTATYFGKAVKPVFSGMTGIDAENMYKNTENEKANTETVSEEAYKKCIEDVTSESNSEDAIYELAEQNARNIVEALISPFVEQLDSEYRLEIQ